MGEFTTEFRFKRREEFSSREERLRYREGSERAGFWVIAECGGTDHLFISCPVCGIITDMSYADISPTGLFYHCVVCPCKARYDARLDGWRGGRKESCDRIRDDGHEIKSVV